MQRFTVGLFLCSTVLLACDRSPSEPGDADLTPNSDIDPQDPLILVPPEALEVEAAAVCPGEYVERGPKAGHNVVFQVAEQARSFWLEPPDHAEHTGPRPLVVAFGGAGESGEDFIQRARLRAFVDAGFFVVAPDSWQNGTVMSQWDAMREPGDYDRPNADIALFDSLVDCLGAHRAIDVHRVYVVGHSAGGAMVNALLQRRSNRLAGGVAASGAFRMTSLPGDVPLDQTLALVTWGGEQDVLPPEIMSPLDGDQANFDPIDEASAASSFYEAQPQVDQVRCSAEVGHVWLAQLNGWMIELLLAHPRGLPGEAPPLPPLPEGVGAECSREPFVFETGLHCPPSSTAGCQESCDFISDCFVENESLAGFLATIVTELGFGETGATDCGGCVTRCEGVAVTAADAEVLACLEAAQMAEICSSGIMGGMPLINGINGCCEGRDDSPYCLDICAVLETNAIAFSYSPACIELLGIEASCTANGVCEPLCSDDPDCDPNCATDGFCNPECPEGDEVDCGILDCSFDGLCQLMCRSMTDPDCPETCAPDGVCTFVCPPSHDPDCSDECGVVEGICCVDEPNCDSGLLCVNFEGTSRCLRSCMIADCQFGDDVGFCIPINDPEAGPLGLCMPPEGLPSHTDECAEVGEPNCTTEYGVSVSTVCLDFMAVGFACVELCPALESGCDDGFYCEVFDEGPVCLPTW